jgi:hypothetical protein
MIGLVIIGSILSGIIAGTEIGKYITGITN